MPTSRTSPVWPPASSCQATVRGWTDMAIDLFSNSRRNVVAVVIVLALLLAAWLAPFGSGERTVTAHFPQSIGIFEGSDVTIMGVPVGRVKSITPEGKSVKVVMTYSSDYKLPADVKAA